MKKPTFRPKYKLFTPGPVLVPDDIREVLAGDLVYHREETFGKLYESVRNGLQKVFMTRHDVYVLTASGTGAMEAAVCNLIGQGDKVLVVTAGKFGERWRELCMRFGGYVDTLSMPYGSSVPPVEVERHLLSNELAKCVFTTLTETSTGAVNDINAYGEICRRLNRILVVDAVAGLGADELRMDDWKVDVACGGSQKALAVPPGLAFITAGPRAWELIENGKRTRYYFDLKAYRNFAARGQTPWTPAISLFYGVDMALKKLGKSGITGYWKRHKRMADYVRSYVKRLGLELFPDCPSNALTVIKMPEGVDGARIVAGCKNDGFLFGNGQGEMRGRIVRIGHMGPVKLAVMDKALACFKKHYRKAGCSSK